MKAFALALTLLVGMTSFAGFGNTTTDLAKNSETVMADLAAPVSVAVTVSELETNNEVFEIGASTVAPFLPQTKASLAVQPFYDSGGGGERDCVDNDNRPPNDQENYRNPRDGISQVLIRNTY